LPCEKRVAIAIAILFRDVSMVIFIRNIKLKMQGRKRLYCQRHVRKKNTVKSAEKKLYIPSQKML
jgi:hypothetical protein